MQINLNKETQMWDIEVNPNLTLSVYKKSWDEPVADTGKSPMERFLEVDTNVKDDVAFIFKELHKKVNPELYKDLGYSDARKVGQEYLLTEGFYETNRSSRWDRKFTHDLSIKELKKVIRQKTIESKVFEAQEKEFEIQAEEWKQYSNDLKVRETLIKPIYLAYQFASKLPKAIEEMKSHITQINTLIGSGQLARLASETGCHPTSLSVDVLGKDFVHSKLHKNGFIYKNFCENFVNNFSVLAEETMSDMRDLGMHYYFLEIFESIGRYDGNKVGTTSLNEIDIDYFLDFDLTAFEQYLVEYQTRFGVSYDQMDSRVNEFRMYGVKSDDDSTDYHSVKKVNENLRIEGYHSYEIEKFLNNWNLVENIKLQLGANVRYNSWKEMWLDIPSHYSTFKASKLIEALRPVMDSDVASSKLDAYNLEWRA